MQENIKESMTKVFILNAPPNAGKDVVASELVKVLGVNHLEFKKPLFDIAKAIAQISDEEWDVLYNDRVLKETPSAKLFGKSPRDHMIFVSENVVKPLYGKDYFGKMFVNNLKEGINVSSDGGFLEELQPTIEKYGSENVYIIRLHRNGCNFDNDSRNYLYDTGCVELDINNNSTLQDLYDKVLTVVTNEEK